MPRIKLKLAKRITDRTDELILSIRRQPVNLPDIASAAERHASSLSYDAQLAHLDGREARASILRKEAARMRRAIPRIVYPATTTEGVAR